MTRCSARARQGDQLVAAKLGELPGFDVPIAFRQIEFVATLHLGESVTLAVVQRRRTQRRIAVEFLEQAFGALWRLEGLCDQARVGDQPANGLQGLRRHAFLEM